MPPVANIDYNVYENEGYMREVARTEETGRVYLSTDCLASGVYVAVASTDGNIVERRKVMVK